MVNANSKDGFSSMSGLYPDRSIRSFSTANSAFLSASELLYHSRNGLSFSAFSFDTKGLSSVSISSNQGSIGSNLTPHPFSTESFASSPSSNVDWYSLLMKLYQLPLTFSTGESKCSFVMNGTSLRLYKSDYSSYSFSSDNDCDKRNRRIDAQILAEEKEEHSSEDYKHMVLQIQELDGIFPADHISPYYTVLHFRQVHKTEGELVFNITLQWRLEKCFQPILTKYDSVRLLLDLKENDWIRGVRAAISNKTATSDLIEQYHEFQNVLITRKLQLRSAFYNVSHYSDSPVYCDGCEIPRNKKKVKAILNYPKGLLIRKFVGNDEEEYFDTRIHRLLSLLSRMVPFQRSEIRCNSHRYSFRIQSFVCSASILVSISGVSGIDHFSNIDLSFLSSMPHRLTKSTLFAIFQLISFPNEPQFSFISSVVISRAVLCSPSIA